MFKIFKKKQQVSINEEVVKPIEYFHYEPLEMAWYIVKYCLDHEIKINMLKLQKLLYYVHIALLVESGGKTSVDTKFKLTKYGAYNDDIYRRYRKYSSTTLRALPVKEELMLDNGRVIKKSTPYSIKFNGCDKVLVDAVLSSYKEYNTFALVEKSRSEITSMNVTKDCIIEEYLLFSYYKNNTDKICGKVFT